MPRMDGFDLARNIRADARLKMLPIIMITSRIAEKHREHAMRWASITTWASLIPKKSCSAWCGVIRKRS
jgi:CheY-like chemotaxis protein